jgi:hypothetical protein
MSTMYGWKYWTGVTLTTTAGGLLGLGVALTVLKAWGLI